MSIERLHVPDRHALDALQRNPAWDVIVALIEMLRRSFGTLRRRPPEPDTSIAWEDGEVQDDGEARG